MARFKVTLTSGEVINIDWIDHLVIKDGMVVLIGSKDVDNNYKRIMITERLKNVHCIETEE